MRAHVQQLDVVFALALSDSTQPSVGQDRYEGVTFVIRAGAPRLIVFSQAILNLVPLVRVFFLLPIASPACVSAGHAAAFLVGWVVLHNRFHAL